MHVARPDCVCIDTHRPSTSRNFKGIKERDDFRNTADGRDDLPLDLVALHFVVMGIATAILVVYCKPVKST